MTRVLERRPTSLRELRVARAHAIRRGANGQRLEVKSRAMSCGISLPETRTRLPLDKTAGRTRMRAGRQVHPSSAEERTERTHFGGFEPLPQENVRLTRVSASWKASSGTGADLRLESPRPALRRLTRPCQRFFFSSLAPALLPRARSATLQHRPEIVRKIGLQ